MGDPTTLTLNLTFLGTVGLGFLMFLVMFGIFMITLLIAGVGKFVALIAMLLVGRFPRNDTIPVVHVSVPVPATADPAPTATAPKAPRPARNWGALFKPAAVRSNARAAVEHHPLLNAVKPEPKVLAEDWAAAVAAADARAVEREKAQRLPLQTTVRDLPDPAVPAEKVSKVAPLVESKLDRPATPARKDPVPESFRKPYIPAGLMKGASIAARSGTPVLKEQIPREQRKAG